MEVLLAKSAGFCFGVRKAVEIAEREAETGGNVCSLGPVIHNSYVVDLLAGKGLTYKSYEELMNTHPMRVVIRSHGVGREIVEGLKNRGHTIVDATCPFVKKIHSIVEDYSKKGYYILVLGDHHHAEVEGIVGWIVGNDYSVVSSADEIEKFSLNTTKPICLVAQTTFNNNKFKECVEIINQKGYDVCTLDTICSATYERQRETEEIATKVDAMIVIGSRNSSNTRKLFDIAKGKCKTYFLSSKEDLDQSVLDSIDRVGITAGASTPDILIREVMLECQK